MSDEKNTAEAEEQEEVQKSPIELMTDNINKSQWISWGLLAGSVVLFAGLLISIILGFGALNDKKSISSNFQLEELTKKITQTLKTVKQEHNENKAYIKEYELLPINIRYASFYDTAINNEQDYSKHIIDYKKVVYDISSRVRGSGEWHNYYANQLNYFIQQSQRRTQKIKAMAVEPSDQPF